MKIIRVDNFDRESISDDLIAESLSKHYTTVISDMLNERFSGPSVSDFYRAVKNDYILYEFKP